MLALVIAVLSASLLGSTHCAGMCGAFAAFAVSDGGSTGHPSRAALNAAYNLGRLVTYVLLGAVAGSLGAALDLGASMIGVQRAAACAAGALMLGFGIVAALRLSGVRIPPLPVPRLLIVAARAGHARAFKLAPMSRAAAVGLLTTLLPCGWLYAFVITSAGTASPVRAAITMGAFWLGTLPIMVAIGVGAQSLAGPLRRHLPLATSLLLVAIGMWTLFGRMAMPAFAIDQSQRPATLEQAVKSVDAAEGQCPLCKSK